MFRKLSWLLLLFPAIAGFSQTYTIEGTVKDSATQQPLIGALVKVFAPGDSVAKYSAITDYDGIFKMMNVAPGQYSIHASYVGYNTLNRQVNVAENKSL